ncbi:MAG: beta-lactamase family protein, partial [Deltaproteobacteria bacterium]|nr:beta-lactamase family protein [Deltaproteobacteria bacterium]
MFLLRNIYAGRFLIPLILILSAIYLSACHAFVRCELDIQGQNIETRLEHAVPCLVNECKVPGVAVAVVRNGEIEYSGNWGKRRADKDAPIDEQTLFPAASLTKPVFAYGALMLVRDGKLDLDRSLSDYLDEPYIEGDQRLTKITA